MRNVLLIVIGLLLGGCNSKLLGTDDEKKPNKEVPMLSSEEPRVGACPEVATPNGFTAQTYNGVFPAGSVQVIQIANEPSSTVLVLLREVGTWFKLGANVSGAYYYERKPGQIVYKGTHLYDNEWCVIQFTPAP